MYLKQANYRAETLLEKYAEPLSTLAWVLGGGDYPQAELREAWRLLLSNLPHDSICGCGIDAIHDEMMQRYGFLDDLGDSIVETAASAIRAIRRRGDRAAVDSATDGSWDGSFAVFNPLLHARSDVVRASIVTAGTPAAEGQLRDGSPGGVPPGRGDAGAHGYRRARRRRQLCGRHHPRCARRGHHASQPPDPARNVPWHPGRVLICRARASFRRVPFHDFRLTYGQPAAPLKAGQIENEFFQVTFRKTDASLTVKDKRTGLTYEGLHVFEDGGDAGDEYTYSWPLHDAKVFLGPAGVSVATEGSAAYQTLVVRGVLRAPARLAPDRQSRSRERVENSDRIPHHPVPAATPAST